MVSFTFDDVPRSAVTLGAAALEARGARGTFYIAGGLVGGRDAHWDLANGEELARLHARGHELGCHTYSHRRASEFDSAAFEAEIACNRASLDKLVPGATFANFAFPYGVGTLRGKRRLARHFDTCRSIFPGINRGLIDRHFLKSVPLIDLHTDAAQIDRLMDATVAGNGWLIFYGHDVCARPSPYGCSPALLEHALGAAQRRGIEILSVAEGLRSAGI